MTKRAKIYRIINKYGVYTNCVNIIILNMQKCNYRKKSLIQEISEAYSPCKALICIVLVEFL